MSFRKRFFWLVTSGLVAVLLSDHTHAQSRFPAKQPDVRPAAHSSGPTG